MVFIEPIVTYYNQLQCNNTIVQIKEVKNYITPKRFWSSLHHVDYKFVIIPVVFVFLRIWTGIMNILYLYIRVDEVATLPQRLNQALLYLSVSDISTV